MTELLEKRAGPSYRCPVCDVMLAAEPTLHTYDARCPDCGYRQWCRKRKVGDVVVLSVLPDRTPELADIELLAESLERSSRVLRVVVDLSGLALIDSTMMARLISMRKRVLAAKGKLVLCGLSPHVRTIFARTHIETLFEIVDTATDAVSTLGSQARRRQSRATYAFEPRNLRSVPRMVTDRRIAGRTQAKLKVD
jgi:anti-anti-sigma factor